MQQASSPDIATDVDSPVWLVVRNTFLCPLEPQELEERCKSAPPRLGHTPAILERSSECECDGGQSDTCIGIQNDSAQRGDRRRRRHPSKKQRVRQRKREQMGTSSLAATPASAPACVPVSIATPPEEDEWNFLPVQQATQQTMLGAEDISCTLGVEHDLPTSSAEHSHLTSQTMTTDAKELCLSGDCPSAVHSVALDEGEELDEAPNSDDLGSQVLLTGRAPLIEAVRGRLRTHRYELGLAACFAIGSLVAWKASQKKFGQHASEGKGVVAVSPSSLAEEVPLRESELSGQSDDFRILLLGQTGSGKTKLLDLLCNWAKLKEIKREALKHHTLLSHLQTFHRENLESEKEAKMSSKTDRASSYQFFVNMGASRKTKVDIVDTPGFGDTRGFQHDQGHIHDIVACLKQVSYVNCIVLVINGRDSRMTATLKYVLTQICSMMPRTILEHVFVVFTNTADDLQLNFDIADLKPYIDECIDERYVVLENPLASIQKAATHSSPIPQARLAKALGNTLDRAFDALDDMFGRIRSLQAVHTLDFERLYVCRQRVERQTMDLLAEYDYTSQVIEEVQTLQKKILAASHEKSLYMNFETTRELRKRKTQATSRHNTLCGYPGCYSNCHTPCYLPKSMDKAVFRHCHSMGDGDKCKVCAHSFTYHYHDEVIWKEETVLESLVDEAMKNKFLSAREAEQQHQNLLETTGKRLLELESKKMNLAWTLSDSIQEFEECAALRPYNQLLVHQLDVIQQAIDSFAPDESGGEHHQGLRDTRNQLAKKLQIVNEALSNSTHSKL